MKILKRRILFTLASETDFFKPKEGFSYYSYSFLYPRLFKYSPSSIRGAVLELVQSGEVDKIKRNNISLFRLTGQGRERLLSFFPLSLGQKKVWDHIWRLAILSTPGLTGKKSRGANGLRKLRWELRKLGFKKFSRGVYITPLAVSDRLKQLLLEKTFSAKIAVIESRRLLLGDDKQLAKQIWPISALLQEYQNLIRREEALLKRLKQQKKLSLESKRYFFLINNDLFSLLERDPGLPKKLLPADWPFSLCHELFLRLAKRIKNEADIV